MIYLVIGLACLFIESVIFDYFFTPLKAVHMEWHKKYVTLDLTLCINCLHFHALFIYFCLLLCILDFVVMHLVVM